MVIKFSPPISDGEVFERRHSQGYTEIAFGEEGIWMGDQRIVRLLAFFHPERYFREVATLQYPEFTCGTHSEPGNPFEANYTGRSFRRYCRENEIPMGDRQNLLELLEHW